MQFNRVGVFMPKWLVASLLTVLPVVGWAAKPDGREPRVPSPGPAVVERLLPTPPVVIRFGWTTSDLAELVAELRASTLTHVLSATEPGVLEFVCAPDSILPWGAALFRVYDLDLLGDLARAEEFAAQIGSRPFVVAPRAFPAPLTHGAQLSIQPPVLPLPVAPPAKPAKPAAPATVATPIIRMPRSPSPPPEPEAVAGAPPPAPRPRPAADPGALRRAAEQLSSAEGRVSDLQAVLSAAQADLRAAQQAVAPLAEDVTARRRLLEAGVIARNDVKAAEERLQDAESVVSGAEGRVAEARDALQLAEADRDAALAGVERAKSPPDIVAEPEPPSRPAAPVAPRMAPPPPPPRTSTPVVAAPPASGADAFPSPLLGGALGSLPTVPPPPDETVRLVGPGDLPAGSDWGPLPWPGENAGDLARRRWTEHSAPWQCVVSQALVPQGSIVKPGTPVLALRPTSVARLRAEVAEPYTSFCQVGMAVEVEFPTEGTLYRGWVSRSEPTRAPRPPGARIEMLLVEAQSGDRRVYRDLEWLVLASPTAHADRAPLAHRPPQPATHEPTDLGALFPLPVGPADAPPATPPDGQLSGRLQLFCSGRPSGFADGDAVSQKKLERLREWHDSFIEGMKTTVFPESGLTLTYPRDGETTLAIERMATRRVSHVPNMCARTVAEALGWGLGDAAMWATGLPGRGFRVRPDGVARPGDIVVWPFTYGPRRSQHVGIAVGQAGSVMLLSNSSGTLGTEPMSPGYLPFYKPAPAAPQAVAKTAPPARPAPQPPA